MWPRVKPSDAAAVPMPPLPLTDAIVLPDAMADDRLALVLDLEGKHDLVKSVIQSLENARANRMTLHDAAVGRFVKEYVTYLQSLAEASRKESSWLAREIDRLTVDKNRRVSELQAKLDQDIAKTITERAEVAGAVLGAIQVLNEAAKVTHNAVPTVSTDVSVTAIVETIESALRSIKTAEDIFARLPHSTATLEEAAAADSAENDLRSYMMQLENLKQREMAIRAGLTDTNGEATRRALQETLDLLLSEKSAIEIKMRRSEELMTIGKQIRVRDSVERLVRGDLKSILTDLLEEAHRVLREDYAQHQAFDETVLTITTSTFQQIYSLEKIAQQRVESVTSGALKTVHQCLNDISYWERTVTPDELAAQTSLGELVRTNVVTQDWFQAADQCMLQAMSIRLQRVWIAAFDAYRSEIVAMRNAVAVS